jgi:N-acetylmuramic acid 6-phosphate etherase
VSAAGERRGVPEASAAGPLPTTEARDPATASIDALDSTDLARLLAGVHARAVDAVVAAADGVALAIDAVAAALANGKRVRLFGAGTSGRLAILDATELPPTFGVDPALVTASIAGGDAAIRASIEGAEDDAVAGMAAGEHCAPGDVAIGVSASGGAPFVCAAVNAAARRGAVTIGIANAPDSPLIRAAGIGIVLATGAEPIAGSTRMKAGTAQKIALNTISTGAMIRLGKTYGNLMVDVVANNAKLRARALRLVREIAGDVDDPAALLAAAGGRVKTAVVMARLGVDRPAAEAALAVAGGRLAALIDPKV